MSLHVSKNYSPTFLERTVFLGQIFFGKVLYDKKTYILIFVSILPLLPTLSFNTATVNDYLNIIIISQETNIFNFAILPLICLILGISAIADEKENKTISQLLSRPIKREEIVFVKWISVVVIGFIIVCLDALIIYIGLCIIVQDFSILFEHLDVLIGVWLFLGAWVFVYGTIFLFLGIIIDKSPLGWGLAIAYFEAFFGQFIFGAFAGNTPYSISNHLYFITAEFFLVDHFNFQIPNFEPINSFLICIGLIVGFLLLSLIVMRRKDFP